MVYQFTEWLECEAIPAQSVELLARVTMYTFFSRFGVLLQLHLNQGQDFVGNLFEA